MNFQSLVSQLANRVNQPHVIETYLRKVWDAAKKDNWISIEDRFPESCLDDCLVSVKGKTKIGHYDKGRDLWIFSTVDYAYTKEGVTHWMPILKIPKS